MAYSNGMNSGPVGVRVRISGWKSWAWCHCHPGRAVQNASTNPFHFFRPQDFRHTCVALSGQGRVKHSARLFSLTAMWLICIWKRVVHLIRLELFINERICRFWICFSMHVYSIAANIRYTETVKCTVAAISMGGNPLYQSPFSRGQASIYFPMGDPAKVSWCIYMIHHLCYTCSAWYNGLSKKLKCRMQCTQNKIIRFMLNAPWRFHVGSNEFKLVGLLPIEYRVEQLMLGHMFKIINGNAPTYLISGKIMNQHRYSTRARELSCVIPRVKSSGLTCIIHVSRGVPLE